MTTEIASMHAQQLFTSWVAKCKSNSVVSEREDTILPYHQKLDWKSKFGWNILNSRYDFKLVVMLMQSRSHCVHVSKSQLHVCV